MKRKYMLFISTGIALVGIVLVTVYFILPKGAVSHPAEVVFVPTETLSVSQEEAMPANGGRPMIPSLSIANAKELSDDTNISILRSKESGTMCCVFFNTRSGPCQDQAFRQALACAVDRDYIAKTLLSGMVNSCKTFVPFSGSWMNRTASAPDFDSIRARKQLDEAGYIMDPQLKTRIDPVTGEALRLTILTPLKSTNDVLWAIGYTLDYYLNAMGVKAVHIALPDQELAIRSMVQRDFDIVIDDIDLAQAPFGLFTLLHSSRDRDWTINYSGIKDEQLDKSLKTLWSSLDIKDAHQAGLEAQARISELLPYVSVCTVPSFSAIGAEWNGVVAMPGSGADNLWTYLSAHEKGSKDGGVLNVASSGSTDDLNPLTTGSAAAWSVLKLIYFPLLYTDPSTLEDVPVLADSWSVDDWKAPGGANGMAVTFNLKSGIKWQDGVDFTSDDIKFCIDYLKLKTIESFNDVASKIDHVDAPDSQTVQIYIADTGYRYVYSLAWMTFLPKHIWEGITDYNSFKPWTLTNPLDSNLTMLIGQGPYILADGNLTDGIKLTWNSGFTLKY